jgi:hypothetical protein
MQPIAGAAQLRDCSSVGAPPRRGVERPLGGSAPPLRQSRPPAPVKTPEIIRALWIGST